MRSTSNARFSLGFLLDPCCCSFVTTVGVHFVLTTIAAAYLSICSLRFPSLTSLEILWHYERRGFCCRLTVSLLDFSIETVAILLDLRDRQIRSQILACFAALF